MAQTPVHCTPHPPICQAAPARFSRNINLLLMLLVQTLAQRVKLRLRQPATALPNFRAFQ